MQQKPKLPPGTRLLAAMAKRELSVTMTADMIGLSPGKLVALIDDNLPVCPDVAIKLAEHFGGSAEGWTS